MTDDRAAFTEARDAGLAIRQQRRIETREELRRRTRCEVAEEIAAWADDLAAGVINRDKPYNRGFIHASETLARHAREIATKEAAPAEAHKPIGVRSTDVGPFVSCSCGTNPTPKHWLETHWPGDSAEGMRLVDELVAREIGTR